MLRHLELIVSINMLDGPLHGNVVSAQASSPTYLLHIYLTVSCVKGGRRPGFLKHLS